MNKEFKPGDRMWHVQYGWGTAGQERKDGLYYFEEENGEFLFVDKSHLFHAEPSNWGEMNTRPVTFEEGQLVMCWNKNPSCAVVRVFAYKEGDVYFMGRSIAGSNGTAYHNVCAYEDYPALLQQWQEEQEGES